MHYGVILKGMGDKLWYYDYFLDGMIPSRTFKLMERLNVDEIGICEKCNLDTHCHVWNTDSGEVYCPILFVDVVKPRWKLKDIL